MMTTHTPGAIPSLPRQLPCQSDRPEVGVLTPADKVVTADTISSVGASPAGWL